MTGDARAQKLVVQRPGRVLIIRGVLNMFSLGLDDLACKLSSRGYRVDVAPPSMALLAAESIAAECQRDPTVGPLVIIGHSLGGRFCCAIPWRWKEHGLAVKLVVILDANPLTPVADNVERCVNLYVTNSSGLFHGQDVYAVDPRVDLVNLDMTKVDRPSGVPGVTHFNIDDSAWIHRLVIEEVDRSLKVASRENGQLRPTRLHVWDRAPATRQQSVVTAGLIQPARRDTGRSRRDAGERSEYP